MLPLCFGCTKKTPETPETAENIWNACSSVKAYLPESELASISDAQQHLSEIPAGSVLEKLSKNLYPFELNFFSQTGEADPEYAAKQLKAGFIYALACGLAPTEAEVTEFIAGTGAALAAEYQTDRILAARYDQEYESFDADNMSRFVYGVSAEAYGCICLEEQLASRVKAALADEYVKTVTEQEVAECCRENPEAFTYLTVRVLLLKKEGSAEETLALAETLAADVHTEADMNELAAEYGDPGWDDDHARSVVRVSDVTDPAVLGYISQGPVETGIARAARVEDNIYIVLAEELRTYAGSPEADPELYAEIVRQLAEDRAEAFVESIEVKTEPLG